MKIILLLSLLLVGCDLMPVKSPQRIIQKRKDLISQNISEFKKCVQDKAGIVQFNCKLTENKPDQYWFPERFSYIAFDNSKCFKMKINSLNSCEEHCIQQKLTKLKFPTVVKNSEEQEYIEIELEL